MAQPAKKSRSTNYTEAEMRVIGSEMIKYDRTINGELSATLTNIHKQRAWENILSAVNAVAPMTRQLDSVSIFI